MLAWRQEMIETSSEGNMIYPETKARYAEWKAKVLDEGMKKGIRKGKREGKRELVRKQLMLRFGELPADAEQRLERASLARLERWAERVLTADSLAAVLTD
jgi:flagellar biosynthesis/type III secretory pathway protein FliH